MKIRFTGAGPVDHPASGLVLTPGEQEIPDERAAAVLELPGVEIVGDAEPAARRKAAKREE